MTQPRSSVNKLLSRALSLEYATIAVATVEAVGALVSGFIAGSVALEAFGVDSLIEIVSAIIVLGELRVLASGSSPCLLYTSHRVIAIG